MITGGPDSGEPEPAAGRFSRFGRLALAGLLAPSIVRTAASAAGWPLRGVLQDALVLLPPILFAAAAVLAASPHLSSRRTRLGVAAGFFMAGLLSAFAYDSLQGLTGREPAGVTVAAVTASFAAGFALATGLTALAAGTGPRVVAGAAARGLGAGACGGLIALAPFLLSLAGAAGRVPYVDMALAVAAAFGCILIPFRLAGAALDAVWPAPSPGGTMTRP